MKKYLSLAIVLLFLSDAKAFAGWYHVETFTGSIGSHQIHFSTQSYDSFGSGITVEGSYYYDTKDSPIALYGNFNDGKLTLCEISDDRSFERIIIKGSKHPFDTKGCPFVLNIDESGANGTWSKGDRQYPVTLKKVGMMDDTDDAKLSGTVEIPFWAQTASHMFIGIHAKSDAGICMEEMRIIDKHSKQVDQKIHFDKDDCNAGIVMTPIYLNVQNNRQNGTDLVSVSFRDSRMGYSQDYIFDAATNRYSLKQ